MMGTGMEDDEVISWQDVLCMLIVLLLWRRANKLKSWGRLASSLGTRWWNVAQQSFKEVSKAQ